MYTALSLGPGSFLFLPTPIDHICMARTSRQHLIGPAYRIERSRRLPSSLHEDWEVVLRNANGVVVLYDRTQGTFTIESPAVPSPRSVEDGRALLRDSEEEEAQNDHANRSTSSRPGFTQQQDFFGACPLCRRPYSQGSFQRRASPPIIPLPPLESGVNEHISSNYFRLLSESLQPSPEVTPAPSRPGTPTFPEISSTLDDSSFLEGYYHRFFNEITHLGKGSNGSVFLCQHVLNGNPLGYFACKKIAVSALTNDSRVRVTKQTSFCQVGNSSLALVKALKEINHLESLRHPNIVSIHHVWLETVSLSVGPPVPCLFALMDYANGGT